MDSMGYLGIFVALVGGIGALWSGLAHRKARAFVEAAKHWREAPGRVISAQIEERDGGTGSSRYVYYVPRIRYAYVVNGREWEGGRLRFGMPSARSPRGAEAMLAPYPAGAEIKVHYDPDKPEDSVLEPGKMGSNLLVAAIVSAFVFLAGAAIVVLAVMGVFSADVSGRWHVRFQGDGVTYEGDLDAVRGAGPLTLAYTTSEGHKRAREDCTLTRNNQHVLVRCTNAQMIEGTGTYSPDEFDLTYEGGSRLTGNVTSHGAAIGTATFTK